MNVSDVLNKAADHIEERGWTTGSGGMNDAGKPLCIQGGINAAIGNSANDHITPNLCPAGQALRDYLCLPEMRTLMDLANAGDHGRRHMLWRWNDAPERTAAEVVEALRACAVIEAARETEGRLIHGPVIEPNLEDVPA